MLFIRFSTSLYLSPPSLPLAPFPHSPFHPQGCVLILFKHLRVGPCTNPSCSPPSACTMPKANTMQNLPQLARHHFHMLYSDVCVYVCMCGPVALFSLLHLAVLGLPECGLCLSRTIYCCFLAICPCSLLHSLDTIYMSICFFSHCGLHCGPGLLHRSSRVPILSLGWLWWPKSPIGVQLDWVKGLWSP